MSKLVDIIAKIESLQDDGGEGVPWSQEELDLIVAAIRRALGYGWATTTEGIECRQ